MPKSSCHWSLSILIPPENIRTFGFLMFSGGLERDQWHEIWLQCVRRDSAI